MNKKIFIVGCSYSHHDVYVRTDETWPALLQEKTNHTIINCSIPGTSNNSYFYRLKEIENKFGTPDKVIVQMTGLYRYFVHTKRTNIQDIGQYQTRDYYYDLHKETIKDSGYFITPSTLFNTEKLNQIHDKNGLNKGILKWLWKSFLLEDSLYSLLEKEMTLIDLYYNDVLFFSWNCNYDLLNLKNYIGSVKYNLLPKEFDNCCWQKNKDDHFNKIGHKRLSEILENYV